MDYYSILGVGRNASQEEIRKAYKKQSMQHHPDRGGDEAQFKRVNEAYSTLKDPQKRAEYDNPHPQFNFNTQNMHGFEDMFTQFGFGARRQTPRNRDISLQARIDLKDVIIGKNLIIQYQLSTGRIETVTVDVPPGAKHGDTIQYEGLGDEGHPQYPRGNLLVRIVVNKQRDWDRDGDNLITKKTINVFDFLTGCAIIIQTLDNRQLELKVPKGTQPNTTFSIPNYGVPNMQTGKRGKLFVTVNAHVPTINNDELLNKIQDIKKEL